jgi:hypothetical protein
MTKKGPAANSIWRASASPFIPPAAVCARSGLTRPLPLLRLLQMREAPTALS